MHPPPLSSIHLVPAHFKLPSSLQHPQSYLNQNIACNWAISPNLGWKIQKKKLSENWHTWYHESADSKSGPTFLKFRPQKQFLGKFQPKKMYVYLKIGMHGISRMLIFIPILAFWVSNPKSIFGQIWVEKFKFVRFVKK